MIINRDQCPIFVVVCFLRVFSQSCWNFWTSCAEHIHSGTMHLTFALVLLSSAAQHVVLAASNPACSSGIYKALLPLSAYAPAESYCSAHYPLSTVTIVLPTPVKVKRTALKTTTTTKKSTTPWKQSTSTTTKSSTTTKGTTSSSNLHQSQWSSLLSAGGNVIKTLCSCIETAPVTTVPFIFRGLQELSDLFPRSLLVQLQQLRRRQRQRQLLRKIQLHIVHHHKPLTNPPSLLLIISRQPTNPPSLPIEPHPAPPSSNPAATTPNVFARSPSKEHISVSSTTDSVLPPINVILIRIVRQVRYVELD